MELRAAEYMQRRQHLSWPEKNGASPAQLSSPPQPDWIHQEPPESPKTFDVVPPIRFLSRQPRVNSPAAHYASRTSSVFINLGNLSSWETSNVQRPTSNVQRPTSQQPDPLPPRTYLPWPVVELDGCINSSVRSTARGFVTSNRAPKLTPDHVGTNCHRPSRFFLCTEQISRRSNLKRLSPEPDACRSPSPHRRTISSSWGQPYPRTVPVPSAASNMPSLPGSQNRSRMARL